MGRKGWEAQNGEVLLGLLEAVAGDSAQSQRRLASELGIALGLVNVYLKLCVRRGLVKVAEVPARRYVYYLTPQGFAEKSRLTLRFLGSSFTFFRRVREDYSVLLRSIHALGYRRVALAGCSDLAEVAVLCSLESGVQVIAIVDASSGVQSVAGIDVISSFDDLEAEVDAVVLTELRKPAKVLAAMRKRFGANKAYVPALLQQVVEGGGRKGPG